MNYYLIISDFLAIILGSLIIGISILSRGRKFAFKILNFYIFILTILTFQSLLLETKIIYSIPHLFRASMPFRYLLGPLFFLFIRSLLQDEDNLRKYDWLHLVPFIFNYIILIPFLSSSPAIKVEIIKYFENTAILNVPSFKYSILNPRWHDAFQQLSILVYNVVVIVFFLNFSKKRQSVIEINNIAIINFARLVVYIFSAANLVVISCLFIVSDLELVLIGRLMISLILLLFAIILVLHPEFLYGKNQPLALKNNRNQLLSQLSFDEANLIAMSNTQNESNLFLGLDYSVLYFNSLAEQEFRNNFQQDLIIGLNFKEFIYPEYENKFYQSFSKAVSGIKNEYYAYSNINKEEKKWHIISFTPIHDKNKILVGISITTQNIDKEINAQNITKQYIKDLEDIAWKEVHLLNAPISNLLSISKFLLKPESAINTEEQDDLINHIAYEVDRLDIVIKEIVERINEIVKNTPENHQNI